MVRQLSSGILFIFMLSACGGGDEGPKLIAAQEKACTEAGGAVAPTNPKSCEFQANITSQSRQVDSKNMAQLVALKVKNDQTAQACEYAAQLKTVQCKFDKVVKDNESCQKQALSFVTALNGFSSNNQSGGGGTASPLFAVLLQSLQSNDSDADCSTEFRNAYLTYRTAMNGALANSNDGCKILQSYIAQMAQKYQGMVSSAGTMQMLSLSNSVQSSSTCAADTVMKMLYTQLDPARKPLK